MAELVDAHGSGPCAFGCGGSSPLLGTKELKPQSSDWGFFVPFCAITYRNINNINELELFGWFFIVPCHPISFLYIPFKSVYITVIFPSVVYTFGFFAYRPKRRFFVLSRMRNSRQSRIVLDNMKNRWKIR